MKVGIIKDFTDQLDLPIQVHIKAVIESVAEKFAIVFDVKVVELSSKANMPTDTTLPVLS